MEPIKQEASGTLPEPTPNSQADAVNPTQNTQDPPKELTVDEYKKMVESLRKENATYRTRAKTESEKLKTVKTALGFGEEDIDPKELSNRLSHQNQNVLLENAILVNAIRFGIPEEGLDYFDYLVRRAQANLAEDEEMSQEDLTSLAREAKAKSIRAQANTSVSSNQSAPPPAGGAVLSVEQFAKLGMLEKSQLYGRDPGTYERLMQEAISRRLI